MNGTEWNRKGEAGQAELEAALTRALRRVDAPEGFAARLAAMAEAEERSAKAALPPQEPRRRILLGWKPIWGAMAALLVAGVLAGHAVHDRHEAQARTHARTQASRKFDVSVQITDRALEHAREQLRRRGVPLDGEP